MSGYTSPASEKSLDHYKRIANEERAQRQEQRRREKRRCLITFWICAGLALAVVIGLAVGLGIGISQRQNQGVALSFTGQNDTYAAMLEDGIYQSSFLNGGSNDFKYTGGQLELSSKAVDPKRILVRVNRSEVHQEIGGFGAAMTDSSADVLLQLKNSSIADYNRVMDYLFNQRTGFTMLRVPLGSSDFAPRGFEYTLADIQGNATNPLSDFNMTDPTQYVVPVLKDALSRNPNLRLIVTPWSAPAWMKTSHSVGNGGSLIDDMQPVFVEYLVRSVQAFNAALNTSIWAISPQNEPTNVTPYPSMTMDIPTMSKILAAMRGRFAQVGLGSIQLFGIEDNWSAMGSANQLDGLNSSAFDGLAFHCYYGNYTLLAQLNAPGKSVHMTECTGITENSVSANLYSVQYWMRNMFSLVASYNLATVLHWNLALNGNNGPRLASSLCTNCIGTLQVDGDSVTPKTQATMLSHHAAASADLSRFNGTSAFRVGATLDPQKNAQPQCLSTVLAMGSKWNKARTDSLQRLGLVLHNTCTNSVDTTIQLENGENVDLSVSSGLTTVVFASLLAPNATTT